MIVTLGNLYYYPLKLYVFITSYLYFRKLNVTGRRNIPSKVPVIFAINHQNALLDALLVSVLSWRNPHFLTRADVFNSTLLNKFLRGLKMLPIYRIRDGFETIKKNEKVFESAGEILRRGGAVGIFPEGSHSLLYRIRPLKKGVARIAFSAESQACFNLGLKIVPVGIQYESHFYPKGRTLVSFGEPIDVSDYKELYISDQNRAFESVLQELEDRLKKLVVHIGPEQDYDDVLESYRMQRPFKTSLKEQLVEDRKLVDCIVRGMKYQGKSDKKNFTIGILEYIWQVVWQIIGFVPRYIIDLILKKTIKDPHFFGTMRFGFTIFLYPLIFAILYLVLSNLIGLFQN